MNIKIKKSTLQLSLISIIILSAILVLLSKIAIVIPHSTPINIWAIFITGLLTGGLTCLAVQGGLLAATIAQREEEKITEHSKITGNAMPILAFVIAKLIAYTFLGFLLGWLGSLIQLSLAAKIIMQLTVVIFMIGTALNILNVHPIFRYFVIQPPRLLIRLVRKQSKSKALFAPALLGAFTVFIPCGTTQAMMALAIGSGSPVLGAAVLFAFILGTSPLFFILGYFATKLGDAMHQKFMKVAAYALILLAIFNLNGAIALTGSNFTLNDLWNNITNSNEQASEQPRSNEQVSNEATIEFHETEYSPSRITVKAGSTVKLKLVNNDAKGCIQAFTIPKLNIQKVIPTGTSDTLTFTAPNNTGGLLFMCGMGMYKGTINVI